MKQVDGAIADYNRAIELQPWFWDAYRNRGSAYANKNNAKAAIADYSKALELRPKDVDSRFLRAVLEEAMGQWDAALPDLDKVIELDPRHASALSPRSGVPAEGRPREGSHRLRGRHQG